MSCPCEVRIGRGGRHWSAGNAEVFNRLPSGRRITRASGVRWAQCFKRHHKHSSVGVVCRRPR